MPSTTVSYTFSTSRATLVQSYTLTALVAAVSTAYTVGQVVRPSAGNGFIYECVVAGTSSGSAPTWPTVLGTTVVDGSVTWLCVGRGAAVLTFTPPTWSSFSAGPFRYAVLADTTPGTAATNPLILCATSPSDQTGGGGSYALTADASGVLVLPY